MIIKTSLCALFWIIFISFHAFAQSEIYHPVSIGKEVEIEGGDLYLSADNKHFFINNEYSEPFVKGYTLPGQTISPLLKYLTNNKYLLLETGFQAKHFFGQKDPISVFPLFTAQVNFTPATQFIMGTLRGDLNHEASDLLFQNEYLFTNKPEYGVQLRHNSRRLWMDIWINWERFIEHGDTMPEQFTAGLSIQLPLLSSSSGWRITAPIQTVIVHVGGEISDFEENGQSDMNNLLGLEIEKNSAAFLNRWGVFGHYLNYKEMKSKKNNAFSNGGGIEAGLFLQKQNHHLRASWWKGHKYQSLRGNPIYQSVSDYDENIIFQNRSMLTAKYVFKKEFSNNFIFSLLVDGYYDIKHSNLSYSYGLQLLYIPQFFLKNIKPTR